MPDTPPRPHSEDLVDLNSEFVPQTYVRMFVEPRGQHGVQLVTGFGDGLLEHRSASPAIRLRLAPELGQSAVDENPVPSEPDPGGAELETDHVVTASSGTLS